jgi:hypothetical protein
MDVRTVERWLSPNLNYDPDEVSEPEGVESPAKD